MRDIRFIAEHRGGRLTLENHRKLIGWARTCAEHILHMCQEYTGPELMHALFIAKEWEHGNLRTGQAMKASRVVHAIARGIADPVSQAVARSVGHAVATAHMADHCPGAALYALKAVRLAGKSVDSERKWQEAQLGKLPPAIVNLVIDTMETKKQGLKVE